MKQLILYFLLLVISSLILIQIALLFPTNKKTEAHKLATSASDANTAKLVTTIAAK